MNKSKKVNWEKVIVIATMLIILIPLTIIVSFISIPYVLNNFTKDIAPIDDSDLRLEIIEVPESDNAYFDFLKIKDSIYYPNERREEIEAMATNQGWNNELAKELISKNEQAFEYLKSGLRKNKYQNPLIVDPSKFSMDMRIDSRIDLHYLARIGVIKSQYLLNEGKSEESIMALFEICDAAQKIQDARSDFLEYLVAADMKSVSLTKAREIILLSSFDNAQLSQYIKWLDNYHSDYNELDLFVKAEYITYVNMIDSMDLEQFDVSVQTIDNTLGYYFHPNKTKLLLAEEARIQIDNLRLACDDDNEVAINGCVSLPDHPLLGMLVVYTQENYIGKAISCLASSFKYSRSLLFNANSRLDAIILLAAIKEYYNDNKKYPNSIDEMAIYLSLSSKFNKENLRYLANSQTIKYQECNDRNGKTIKEELTIEIK